MMERSVVKEERRAAPTPAASAETVSSVVVVTELKQLDTGGRVTGRLYLALNEEIVVAARRRGLSCVNWEDYRTPAQSFRQAAEVSVAMVEAWSKIPLRAGGTLADAFVYEGHSFWEIVEPDFFAAFLHLMDEWLLAEHILRTIRPGEVVLLGSGHRIERIFRLLAQTRSIAVREMRGAFQKLGLRILWAKRRQVHSGGEAREIWLPRALTGPAHALRSLWRSLGGRRRNWGRGMRGTPARALYFAMGRESGIGPDGLWQLVRRGRLAGEDLQVMDWLFSGARESAPLTREPADSFEAYISSQAIRSAWRARRRFRAAWRRCQRDPAVRAGIAYASIPLWEIAGAPLQDIVEWCMPDAVLTFEVMREVGRRKGARLVIMPDKHARAIRAMAAACRQIGITTIALPGRAAEYMDRHQVGRPVQVTDWTLVEGTEMRRWLVALGARADRLVVTGNPYADQGARLPAIDRGRVCARLGVDPRKPLILVITSPATELNRKEDKIRYLRGVYGAVRECTWASWVIKVHPGERDSLEQTLAREMGVQNLTILRQAALHELLEASDLVIFHNSTVGHEAVALGRPLVQVNLSPSESDYIPCAEMGAALPAYQPEAIGPAIRRVLFDEATRSALAAGRARYTEAYMGAANGRAAGRIAAEIHRVYDGIFHPGATTRAGDG